MTDKLSDGPSEAACEVALNAIRVSETEWACGFAASEALRAAHDPALGDARSVNEAWCRADQTRRIFEWMRTRKTNNGYPAVDAWAWADAIVRA
jgi:hypothetical protein